MIDERQKRLDELSERKHELLTGDYTDEASREVGRIDAEADEIWAAIEEEAKLGTA